MTLRSDDDQAAVDRAAAAVPSVIDAALAELPEDLRASLATRCERPDTTWVAAAGDDGALAMAAWCRAEIGRLRRHHTFDAWRISERTRLAIRRFEHRPLGPWLWIELLGAIPSHKRTLAEAVYAQGAVFRENHLPAVRAAIRARISTRGLLFERLRSEGVLALDELVEALADPPLRAIAEAELAPRVAEVEARLRAGLADATPGTREAIVRLLRRIDERVDAVGETPQTNLAGLELRLRGEPTDVATAQVWADLMQDEGDPRGTLVTLDLAIGATDDHARKLELSAERATLFARERKRLIGRPGGVPFREKYLGRGYLAFGSQWSAALRGSAARRFDRVLAFLRAITNLNRPSVESHLADDTRRANAIEDDAEFRKHCIDAERLVMASFKLTWPSTRTLLPYQEAGHYPTGELSSSLRLNLASGKLALTLQFPFEDPGDPQFVAIYDAAAETLTRLALPASGFMRVTPTVDGKKMKTKQLRFAR